METSPQIVINLAALIASLALVALNGFFVAAEFAIVKVRRTRLEELAGQGIARARISILCVDQLDEYLSATQLGITVVSLGLGWLGESAFSGLLQAFFPELFAETSSYHLVSVGISFFLITLLHVVLGELVPKSLAIQDAERVTLWVSKPLRIFYLVSRPLINTFTALANLILKLLGYHRFEEPPLTENELKLVMKESREDGVITDSEAQIIVRAFEFADLRAGEIMMPKDKVEVISLKRPLEENLKTVRTKMHTRFPLCDEDFRSVVGIVHMKDVWPQLLQKLSNEAFQKCARPPIFIEPSLKQDQLMKLFQSARAHMAIVQDPKTKENLGIVTLETILEHLVGDIRDEHGN